MLRTDSDLELRRRPAPTVRVADELIGRIRTDMTAAPASLPGTISSRGRTFTRLFEWLPCAAVLCNAVGDLLAVNKEWRGLFGPLEATRDRMWFVDAVHPRERDAAREEFAAMLRKRRHAEFEHRYRTLDGEYLWLDWKVVATTGEHGCLEMLGVAHDTTATRRAHATLADIAHRDGLTGLATRERFREMLADALHTAARTGRSGSLIYIDLDDFKSINDRRGHAVGDRVLEVVAHRIVSTVRRADDAARLGGDEFGVLISDVRSTEIALRIADRLLDDIRAPIDAGDTRVSVGASAGLADFPRPGTSVDILLDRADAAMYAAKRSGRNRTGIDARSYE